MPAECIAPSPITMLPTPLTAGVEQVSLGPVRGTRALAEEPPVQRSAIDPWATAMLSGMFE
ncbi:MAG: hypothetical protein EXS03_03985 [Phycisphaerales bacterium]|nr:hypothetical protein [Phycisphaerales bacterium]